MASAAKSKPVDPERSARVVESVQHGDHRIYQYRPAYDDFGFSPVKSKNGKLSKELRAAMQARIDSDKLKGLTPPAETVEEWWEKKKEQTRIQRNKRRRLLRASS